MLSPSPKNLNYNMLHPALAHLYATPRNACHSVAKCNIHCVQHRPYNTLFAAVHFGKRSNFTTGINSTNVAVHNGSERVYKKPHSKLLRKTPFGLGFLEAHFRFPVYPDLVAHFISIFREFP